MEKKIEIIEDADFTSRLLGYLDFKDRVENGKYQFEMKAAITDGNYNGNIYWIFEMPVGDQGENLKEIDDFDYSVENADRIEWYEVCANPKCTHDYLRILTNDYTAKPSRREGEYQCTLCGDIKTKAQLDLLGIRYFD